jgi:tyrosine-protein phosphatase SIW14
MRIMTSIRRSRKILFGSPVLVLLLLSAPSADGLQAPEKEPLPGGETYTRVDPNVACGGVIPLGALSELKRRGFVAVINLRLASEPGAKVEEEGEAARAAGLKYIHIPFNYGAPDIPAIVDVFLKAVLDPANQPVYIHSAAAHRVGGLWLIKRVLIDGWGVERALAEAEIIGLSEYSRPFALNYVKTHSR